MLIPLLSLLSISFCFTADQQVENCSVQLHNETDKQLSLMYVFRSARDSGLIEKLEKKSILLDPKSQTSLTFTPFEKIYNAIKLKEEGALWQKELPLNIGENAFKFNNNADGSLLVEEIIKN